VTHANAEGSFEKLLFLGSSCIYPKFADQPLKEDHLLQALSGVYLRTLRQGS